MDMKYLMSSLTRIVVRKTFLKFLFEKVLDPQKKNLWLIFYDTCMAYVVHQYSRQFPISREEGFQICIQYLDLLIKMCFPCTRVGDILLNCLVSVVVTSTVHLEKLDIAKC